MCLPILLFLIIYLYVESLLFAYVSAYIGGVGIFYEIILTVLLGSSIQASLKQALANTSDQNIKHVPLKYLGSLLLMFPGILSDMIGLLLQIPWVRQLFYYFFSHYSLAFLQNIKLQSSFFYGQQEQQSTAQPSSEEQLYRFLHAQEQSDINGTQAQEQPNDSVEAEATSKATADQHTKTNGQSKTVHSTRQATEAKQGKVPKIIKTTAHKID